jgi:FlaA1/EpsC-like NDP-sugar epimerase
MSTANAPLFVSFSRRLIFMSRQGKIALMILADLIALPACLLIAILLGWGDVAQVTHLGPLPYLFLAIITVTAFFFSQLYHSVIRYIDLRFSITASLALGIVVALSYMLAVSFGFADINSRALLLYWLIAFAYVLASRMSARALLHAIARWHRTSRNIVAIYGAGECGAQLAHAMRASHEYLPVCFFDEKHILNERLIAGLRVIHSDRLLEVVRDFCIQYIVIAVPAVSRERLGAIIQMLREAGITVRISHNPLELADDRIPAKLIQGINLENLLGRHAVPPRPELLSRCVRNKAVLVTGAGGSIGGEICRQIALLGPRRVHLLDHSEFALYTIKQDLLTIFPGLPVQTHLGSVCCQALVERIIDQGQIDTIYHAAAYKHVPLVEANIVEGIRNNVLGARVVASAAEKLAVETCVLISSDKAVHPSNIMGASKRIAELIFQAAASRTPRAVFCMVRFGNVLGSSGSVVPLFKRQIDSGGPLTITHPEADRYFMLIPEAAQLVIQAGAMAKGGEVFVLDMGQPIRIVELARTMIAMAGLSEKTPAYPHGDIGIEVIGLFPGEKIHEELLTGGEPLASEHPRIMWVREAPWAAELLDHYLELLISACNKQQIDAVDALVRTLVTGYGTARKPCSTVDSRGQQHDLPVSG